MPAPTGARRGITAIALTGLVLQMLMAGAMRVPADPQYFFGTFVLHALLAWLAVDALGRLRPALGHAAVAAYGLSAAAVTLGTMWNYLRPTAPATPLDPAVEMPTLGDSVAVVRALGPYQPGEEPALTDIDFYHRFPQTLRTLRLLMPPGQSASDTAVNDGPMLIRFRPAFDGSAPKVEVVSTASLADLPAAARPIKVSPLPANWEPGKD